VISGASSVKIWHPPRTDREKGSEEGKGRGNKRIKSLALLITRYVHFYRTIHS
jgi:hypothetical protein